ncbi:MAG TPA: NUDIX domain-containing protein [Pirellulales bacterium]|nr:NUDIX domain-containing protein [Pirellulales bacterium]
MPESAINRRGAVAVIRDGDKLLVIRRAQQVVAPGAYCFPGGGIEPGESEEEALIRELVEELHVEVRPHRRLWSSVTPWKVELVWWLACLPPGSMPVPAPAEVESFHWHTIDEIGELPELLESNRQFLAALARGEFSLEP